MPPRPAVDPVAPPSSFLNVDAQAERLMKGMAEMKKSKVELEAKLGATNREVMRLKAVLEDLRREMGRLRKSKEDDAGRLEAVKRQLEDEVVTLKADNGRLNTTVPRLTGERHQLYNDVVSTEEALRETKMELEKTKRINKADDTLREIKGCFLKFAAALFVYCIAMAMLKVADPANNDEVKAFARCNLGTLCTTIVFIFLSYVYEWGKVIVLVCFFLLAAAALLLSWLLFNLQKDNLIST